MKKFKIELHRIKELKNRIIVYVPEKTKIGNLPTSSDNWKNLEPRKVNIIQNKIK
jgi:hypothetical protein